MRAMLASVASTAATSAFAATVDGRVHFAGRDITGLLPTPEQVAAARLRVQMMRWEEDTEPKTVHDPGETMMSLIACSCVGNVVVKLVMVPKPTTVSTAPLEASVPMLEMEAYAPETGEERRRMATS